MNDLKIKEVSSLKYLGSPPLWEHQKKAVNFISRYFRNPENIKFAAMIRMPTATGKTGIMAIVSNFFPRIKNILIVAPAADETGVAPLAFARVTPPVRR